MKMLTVLFGNGVAEEISIEMTRDDFTAASRNAEIVKAACTAWLRSRGLEWTWEDAMHASVMEQRAKRERRK